MTTTVTVRAPGYPEKRARINITENGQTVSTELVDVGGTVERVIYDSRSITVREELPGRTVEDDLHQDLREALAAARIAGVQIFVRTGVNVLPQLDLEYQVTLPEPTEEQPIYDAGGVSQPFGAEKLVMLKLVEELRERVRDIDPAAADLIPKLFACVPGRNKLQAYSDDWIMIDTEISNAAFVSFGNPAEALNVNKYERRDGAMPYQRVVKLYQQYVPGAMALPAELTTGTACAARVAEYTRAKMMANTGTPIPGLDFSPARPLQVKG